MSQLKNQKFDIIMFNMSSFYDWDHGIVNRNYNILNTLAKEDLVNRIIAVDFLPIGLKKGIKHYVQNILWEPKTAEMIYGDLTSACYQKTDKIFIYTTIDSVFSMKHVARELKRVEKILNLKNIIFWSYNPLFVEFIDQLDEKLHIFDTVDNWAEHASYTRLQKKKKILANYKTISTNADLIFTVSNELVDFYKTELNRSKDVYWIPNGVDFDYYNNTERITKKNQLSEINQPIIGYLGTIQNRVDLELLVQIAKDHPDKILALCGPVWPNITHEIHKKLKNFNNVIFTERISYQDAPSFMNKFDVAIIPHKIDEFIKSTNPMKMYEYLACGKPVVSTEGAGLDMFKDYIYLSNDKVKFSSLITQALAEDSALKQEQRRQVVKAHSWKARVDKMIELIENKLNSK